MLLRTNSGESFHRGVPLVWLGLSESVHEAPMYSSRPISEEKPSELRASMRVENVDARGSNPRRNPAATALCQEFINEDDGIGSKSPDPIHGGGSKSFESLAGGIQDRGSQLPQSSAQFCSQKRMNSVKYPDCLQLNCTEGLGFESSDEREDSVSLGSDHSTASSPRLLHAKPSNNTTDSNNNNDNNNGDAEGDRTGDQRSYGSQAIVRSDDHPMEEERRRNQRWRTTGSFPPPLPSIARNGQPWIILRSFRTDGRFVLREVKSPPQEILHAWRQDGRLKLQLVHRVDEDKCSPTDDATGDGDGDGDESEKKVAEVAGVEMDGTEASSEILH